MDRGDDALVLGAADLRRHTAFSREFGGDGLPFFPRFLACADPGGVLGASADNVDDASAGAGTSGGGSLDSGLSTAPLLCFQRGGALHLLSLRDCGADGGGVRVNLADGDGDDDGDGDGSVPTTLPSGQNPPWNITPREQMSRAGNPSLRSFALRALELDINPQM